MTGSVTPEVNSLVGADSATGARGFRRPPSKRPNSARKSSSPCALTTQTNRDPQGRLLPSSSPFRSIVRMVCGLVPRA